MTGIFDYILAQGPQFVTMLLILFLMLQVAGIRRGHNFVIGWLTSEFGGRNEHTGQEIRGNLRVRDAKWWHWRRWANKNFEILADKVGVKLPEFADPDGTKHGGADMRMMGLMGLVGLMIVAAGCGTVNKVIGGGSSGGAIGALQSVDDKLAAQAGLPPGVLSQIRSTLGVIDVRKLPTSSRILPLGWTWKQDILDQDGKPVDVSKFHRGPPYIIPDGTTSNNTVTAADLFPVAGATLPSDPVAALTVLIDAIKADPTLIQSVTNAP